MIKIARKIEMPDIPRGRPPTYPWHKMEIGDSFECPYPFNTAYTASRNLAPKKFSVRKYKDGYRCWRVK